jgi:hypothetical protein
MSRSGFGRCADWFCRFRSSRRRAHLRKRLDTGGGRYVSFPVSEPLTPEPFLQSREIPSISRHLKRNGGGHNHWPAGGDTPGRWTVWGLQDENLSPNNMIQNPTDLHHPVWGSPCLSISTLHVFFSSLVYGIGPSTNSLALRVVRGLYGGPDTILGVCHFSGVNANPVGYQLDLPASPVNTNNLIAQRLNRQIPRTRVQERKPSEIIILILSCYNLPSYADALYI